MVTAVAFTMCIAACVLCARTARAEPNPIGRRFLNGMAWISGGYGALGLCLQITVMVLS